MPAMLKVSIITPSFNQARFIERTLESVHRQRGLFELEHIVIDGGSTDGTVGILRRWDGRVRWVSEQDEGQADALNKGLAMAGGDVIGWLNSDDLYEEGALSAVAEVFASQPGTAWLYGKVRIVDEQDREIRRWITRYKNLKMRRWSLGRLLRENWISQMGVFWRSAAGREVGPFRKDLHYCMDYDYWLRLGRRWPGRFVDRCLAAFRWYAASKSGAGYSRQFAEELEVARAAAGDDYPWAIRLHRLNVVKIVTAYRLMGWLGR